MTHYGCMPLANNMDYDPNNIAHKHYSKVEQSIADYQLCQWHPGLVWPRSLVQAQGEEAPCDGIKYNSRIFYKSRIYPGKVSACQKDIDTIHVLI